MPPHAPPEQMNWHIWPLTHIPAMQVCTVRPLHCMVPFAHMPVHAPFEQIMPNVAQAAPLLAQLPSAPQV
jgi:hypothetical protein